MYTAKGGKVWNALLNQTTKQRHAEHKIKYDTIAHIKPDNLGALDAQDVIEFTINTETSEFSFLESPIAIGYVFKKKGWLHRRGTCPRRGGQMGPTPRSTTFRRL
jgi:hypothetical protein